MPTTSVLDTLAQAREVLLQQAAALTQLAQGLGDDFERAVALINQVDGHLVVSGVGKSGLVGRKIVATLASTGTPSFFMHPTEAFHGDLGCVTDHDAAVLISYSGETEELVRLIPALRERGVPIIALTGSAQSSIARLADVHLSIAVERECCPHNLAPTTSTTVTMALGDALAVSLMAVRRFAPEDFARFHPGGSLGKALAQVGQRMRTCDLPLVAPEADLGMVVRQVTAGRVGMAIVASDERRVCGVVTDGDIRRALDRMLSEGVVLSAQDIMTRDAVVVAPTLRMRDAKQMLERHRIKAVPVVDANERLVGVLDWADFV